MCWNRTIKWKAPDGRPDQISHFVEKLCAFCIRNPYDGSEHFPETVAKGNAGRNCQDANLITDIDFAAMNRLHARAGPEVWQAIQEAWQENEIDDLLGDVQRNWRLFTMADWRWKGEARPAIEKLISACCDIRGIQASVATKLLWIKRPHLIPICDGKVRGRLGCTKGNQVHRAMTTIDRLRKIGRDPHNKRILNAAKAYVSDRLPGTKPYTWIPPVRILEAVIWLEQSNPSAPPEFYCL